VKGCAATAIHALAIEYMHFNLSDAEIFVERGDEEGGVSSIGGYEATSSGVAGSLSVLNILPGKIPDTGLELGAEPVTQATQLKQIAMQVAKLATQTKETAAATHTRPHHFANSTATTAAITRILNGLIASPKRIAARNNAIAVKLGESEEVCANNGVIPAPTAADDDGVRCVDVLVWFNDTS
jgi:hypothetical protein